MCRAAYPQHSIKIQKLFFDCSRAAAVDSLNDSSFTVEPAELEELNARILESEGKNMLLEAAISAEKSATNGLTEALRKLRQEHDVARRELASTTERLRNLDRDYQQDRRHSIDLELETKQLRATEKRLRAQLSAFSFTKEEEKQALVKRDAPKEELLALITTLKRQNTELTVQVQKLEQDVMMQEERSGSAFQLLSNIDRGARFDAGPHSTTGLHDSNFRKRARMQSAVATYVQGCSGREAGNQDAREDIDSGGFSALRLAKQYAPFTRASSSLALQRLYMLMRINMMRFLQFS